MFWNYYLFIACWEFFITSKFYLLIFGFGIVFLSGCKKNDDGDDSKNAKLSFSFKFDPTLPRLNNLGEDAEIPDSNAAQNPKIVEMSAHYIELAQNQLTKLGDGAIVYHASETKAGGENAVDFDKAIKAGDSKSFLSVPIKNISPGTYEWVRVSITYQNFDIDFYLNQPPVTGTYTGRVSSFVGFNTFISNHTIKDSTLAINDDKKQGFWAFETTVAGFKSVQSGDAKGTTVVNPISSTSPVPAGSCVVTGKLAKPLVITGEETSDIELVLAFSVNNSFEWTEINKDGKWEPGAGEKVVDMGLRGLHPFVK